MNYLFLDIDGVLNTERVTPDQTNQVEWVHRLILFLYSATPDEKTDFSPTSIRLFKNMQYDFELSK